MNTTTTHLSFLLFLFISSFLLIISPSLAAATFRCNPNDYKVLLNIKKSLNNPFPTWIPNTDCCEWNGVECDPKTNRTITLQSFSDGLTGKIPDEIGDLPYLEILIIQESSNITGSIPLSISKLKNLKELRLPRLSLSGPVPKFFNKLTKLTHIDLSYNQFSGSIPSNLADLKNLENIVLDGNKLTGSIPESFGKFTGSIPSLFLSRNHLSGQIPKSLGDMDFYSTDFSRNKLVGDASMLFNPKHTKMASVDLSRNQLEFDLTKVNKLPRSLIALRLNHNKVFGRIPKEMKDLLVLDVSYNRLCGKIPTGGRLQSYPLSYSFGHNKCLCGLPLKTKCK